MDGTYEIVFQKLEEAIQEESAENPSEDSHTLDESRAEAEEISELRRIVLEITQPEPFYFSGT